MPVSFLCFIPAPMHPLLVTWLPSTFFDWIFCLSTFTIWDKMGYHQTLPCSMVFAPCSIGGVGLCHLSHKQGAWTIIILLHHLCAHTLLGSTSESFHPHVPAMGQSQPISFLIQLPAHGFELAGYLTFEPSCMAVDHLVVCPIWLYWFSPI